MKTEEIIYNFINEKIEYYSNNMIDSEDKMIITMNESKIMALQSVNHFIDDIVCGKIKKELLK